jgi:hypothetical protein
MSESGRLSFLEYFVPGVGVLIAAVPITWTLNYLSKRLVGSPEISVFAIGILSAFILLIPAVIYLVINRKHLNPDYLGLIILVSVLAVLVAIYIFQTVDEVTLPADILIWSESDFVNDMLKHRVGYPLYTEQSNNESFIYTPGAPWLTYQLARLLGSGNAIPEFRLMQVRFTLLAVFLAVFCSYRLVQFSSAASGGRNLKYWGAYGLPFLLLLATNTLTNPFVHNLHNDALALLISIFAYWLVLEYMTSRKRWIVMLMALLPGLSFMVKQSLAVWAVLFMIYLYFVQEPRSLRRVLVFGLFAFGGVGLAVFLGYTIWGEHFIYWTFFVLWEHPRSILRSFQHLLDAWVFFGIGLFAGYVLLRGKRFKSLFWAWFIWLALFMIETQTSGVAWMMNHMGPACVIAGIWFIPAVIRSFPTRIAEPIRDISPQSWLRTALKASLLGLLLSGLYVVRVPVKSLPDDVYRYIKEIEHQFSGMQAERVLLDAGTWVYAGEGIIMKDRAPSIGDRGLGEIGDFSGIIGRIEDRYYSKILLRNLNSPDFWYDHYLWKNPSGIREALLENYTESGRIEAVSSRVFGEDVQYLFQDISILVPDNP